MLKREARKDVRVVCTMGIHGHKVGTIVNAPGTLSTHKNDVTVLMDNGDSYDTSFHILHHVPREVDYSIPEYIVDNSFKFEESLRQHAELIDNTYYRHLVYRKNKRTPSESHGLRAPIIVHGNQVVIHPLAAVLLSCGPRFKVGTFPYGLAGNKDYYGSGDIYDRQTQHDMYLVSSYDEVCLFNPWRAIDRYMTFYNDNNSNWRDNEFAMRHYERLNNRFGDYWPLSYIGEWLETSEVIDAILDWRNSILAFDRTYTGPQHKPMKVKTLWGKRPGALQELWDKHTRASIAAVEGI